MPSYRDRPPLKSPPAAVQDGRVIRLHDDPGRIDAVAWDALLERQPAPTPFMQSAYLAALHKSQSAVRGTGWAPCFMTVEEDGALLGGVPLYLKTHSYGEYGYLCRINSSDQLNFDASHGQHRPELGRHSIHSVHRE